MPTSSGDRGPSGDLGPSGERAWERLSRLMELAEGFWIAWLFTDFWWTAEALMRRTEQKLGASGGQQRVHAASDHDDASILRALVRQEERCELVWVDFVRLRGAGAGERWESLHLLLNERRELLRKNLPGGLILAGPRASKAWIPAAAPDLWTYRSLVMEIEPPEARFADSPKPGLEALEARPQYAPAQRVPAERAPAAPSPGAAMQMAHQAIRRSERLGDPVAHAEALLRASRSAASAGDRAEAKRLARAACEALEGDLGGSPEESHKYLKIIGDSKQLYGDINGAKKAYISILKGERVPPNARLHSLKSLSRISFENGDYSEAKELLKDLLEAEESQLNTPTVSTIFTRAKLGLTLHELNDPEWEPHMRQALEDAEQFLGEDHTLTLNIMSTVAMMMMRAGKMEQARSLALRHAALTEGRFEEQNTATATADFGLGSIFSTLGDLEAAEEHLSRSLEVRKATLGEGHAQTRQASEELSKLRAKKRRKHE